VRRTALVLVALPEEMPLNETEDLWRRLGPQRELVAGVVLNEVHPAPVPDAAFYRSIRPALSNGADEAGREALTLVDAALDRMAKQEAARQRLARFGVPRAEIPFLFRRDLTPRDLRELSPALGDL
jgi:anion-transporting  ArsA/GET3 family ATPase